MLLAMMQETRNFFVWSRHEGAFEIAGNALSPLPACVASGQYIAVTGSRANDGLYKLGEGGALLDETGGAFSLFDENFDGVIYGLAVPHAFVTLAGDIGAWCVKNPVSGVTSESFGNYSRTRATGLNGAVLGWIDVFAERLTPYRRMFKEVPL